MTPHQIEPDKQRKSAFGFHSSPHQSNPLAGKSAPTGEYFDELQSQLGFISSQEKGIPKPPKPKANPLSGIKAPTGEEFDELQAQLARIDAQEGAGAVRATPSSTNKPAGFKAKQTAQAAGSGNDVSMTVTEGGLKSFTGRDISEGFTVNGQPFESRMNVVSSDAMQRLLDDSNTHKEARVSLPQTTSQATGFRTNQSDQQVPQSGFEQQVNHEIYRQATTPMRGAQNRQLTASQRGALDKLSGNLSSERNSRDIQMLRNEGSLNQTAMIQAGQNQRAGAQLALDTARFNSDEYARGFQVRQDERLERLRESYEAAETPEQRSAIAEQLKILNGAQSGRKVQDGYVMVDQVYGEPGNETTARVAIDPATGKVIGGKTQSTQPEPPENHIQALRKNPEFAKQFDAKYGQGASARYLGGQS